MMGVCRRRKALRQVFVCGDGVSRVLEDVEGALVLPWRAGLLLLGILTMVFEKT
jgi:hypothetical protein